MIYNKEQLKNIFISDYLTAKGFEKVRITGGQLLYHSPLTNEHTPSFYVDVRQNLFNCFSTGQGGDIIRLVQLLENVDFQGALAYLSKFESVAPKESQLINPTEKVSLTRITDLRNPSLIRYVEGRKITISIARRYLSEVYYTLERQTGHQNFYGVGFRNELNGFEVRNSRFKGCIGKKYYRYIKGKESIENGCTVLLIFEGFFDFLSFLVHRNMSVPPYDVIVLNSTSLLAKALNTIQLYDSVIAYFDNDNAGIKAFQTLCQSLPFEPLNASQKYFPLYNDYNDFLCQKKA